MGDGIFKRIVSQLIENVRKAQGRLWADLQVEDAISTLPETLDAVVQYYVRIFEDDEKIDDVQYYVRIWEDIDTDVRDCYVYSKTPRPENEIERMLALAHPEDQEIVRIFESDEIITDIRDYYTKTPWQEISWNPHILFVDANTDDDLEEIKAVFGSLQRAKQYAQAGPIDWEEADWIRADSSSNSKSKRTIWRDSEFSKFMDDVLPDTLWGGSYQQDLLRLAEQKCGFWCNELRQLIEKSVNEDLVYKEFKKYPGDLVYKEFKKYPRGVNVGIEFFCLYHYLVGLYRFGLHTQEGEKLFAETFSTLSETEKDEWYKWLQYVKKKSRTYLPELNRDPRYDFLYFWETD